MTHSPYERLRISTVAIDASMLRVVAIELRSQWDAAAELFVIRGLAGVGRFAVYQHMIYTNNTGLVCDLLLVYGIEKGLTRWVCLTSSKEDPTLYNAAMLLDLEAMYVLARSSSSESVSPDGMVGLCARVNEVPVYEDDYTIYEVTFEIPMMLTTVLIDGIQASKRRKGYFLSPNIWGNRGSRWLMLGKRPGLRYTGL
jgi:hypothetical protein